MMRWKWTRPTASLELAGRAASLVLTIACAANILLYWVDRDRDAFTVIISIASALAAGGMATRLVLPANKGSQEATWLACGVWAAQLMEIATADHVAPASKFRSGGFFLAFLIASACVYLVERIARHTDKSAIP